MKTLAPVLALLALVPARALACAACGCGDPTLTVMGSETPFAGRVRASLEAGTSDVSQGRPGMDEVSTRESRVDLGLSWSVSDRLVLAARMPLVMRSTEAANLSGASAWGPGDLELSGRFVLLRDRLFAPRHALSVIAGIRLPTGLQRGDLDAMPGSGSFDPMAGLAYSCFAGRFSLHASAMADSPGVGAMGHRPSRSVLAGIAGQWQATPWLAPRFGIDARQQSRAEMDGMIEPDSGGFAAWLSPGLALAPMDELLLVAAARLPFAESLVGHQTAGPVFSLGVVRDF